MPTASRQHTDIVLTRAVRPKPGACSLNLNSSVGDPLAIACESPPQRSALAVSKERCLLPRRVALTEAITLVSQGNVPDALYEKARETFSEEELVNLTLVIITINGWNRLAITFRMVPGEYQPGRK
jgi:hypothetical protein